MDTATLDFNTLTLLVTLLVAIMGSTLTIITLMFRQFNQLDTKIGNLDTKTGNLDTRITGLENTVTALDGKVDALDGKVDRMGRDVSDARERLARIEGHLMAPEGFRMRGVHPPAPDQPSTENPDPDHRQAG